MFSAMLESKDVMGMFVGHDHNNDYIGTVYDICLAFGRVTGLDAYGELERGARVIELYEGAFQFDSWIRTKSNSYFKYHFPNNELYPNDNTHYLPATKFNGKKNGLNFKYYEGKFKSVSELSKATLVKSGTLKNITLQPSETNDYFAFEYLSWINIPEKGIYRFSTSSDDGSALFIDGSEIVNNDGSHSLQAKSDVVALEKGFHKLKVLYFESYMGNELKVDISSISMRKNPIPENWLFID
jgi:hypothetical protein